jgi:ABC-type lipoprotein export system ATPase subunit
MKKKFYISVLFSNSLNIKLKTAENNYTALDTKIKNKKSRYDDVFENISMIIKKYDLAKKQYQSSIANNIAVPMFVFSGKIIQNYPLGLGVLIQVENNAIIFKTGNMKSDIFNNLSTGQLNGVVISLLLSIKEIFTTSSSLNTLLIDDPLQTIDEISAISLIDLLSEHFGDTQILLSTHEDDKQFLMKKKYEQSGRNCKVLNMQEEYLRQ